MLEARYARQMILKEIGRDGQEKLAKSRVLIVGMGGLGSPAALYLAAAGVGTLGLVDDDQVEISNLQRQVLYGSSDQGQSKVERAAVRLQDLNPELKLEVHKERFSAANAIPLVQEYDLILDGTDNFAAKFTLNDVAVKLQKPLIYGSILRWEGQLAVFWAPYGPCYRCLFPSPPERPVANCAEAGVVGALAGTVGSLQALEAVKLIVSGIPPFEKLSPLVGHLWLIRSATMETQRLRIHKNPACPVCSKPSDAIQLSDGQPSEALCGSQLRTGGSFPASFEEYSAASLVEADRWREFQWIDVREREEWNQGHIPGALHWPLSDLMRGQMPRDLASQPLLLYCQGGRRSLMAGDIMLRRGFTLKGHLKEGFSAWNGPVERPLPS